MKQFRKFMRFLVALTCLVPYWVACSLMDAFVNWLNGDEYLVKIISRDHLDWLLWRG